MLSIGKLAAGQQQYYLDAVAAGVEDYYAGRGEVPGRWLGGGSAELALAGPVEPVDLHAVLSGLDPRTLERLARGNRKLPGFDLTFSAPKSVSLVWALGSADVAAEVVAAHEAAVDATVGWLEQVACAGRRGRDGLRKVATSGFVAAGFRHRTSRAGDPQLHTHVLVANMAKGTDGRWGALDGRQLYAHARTAGALYRAELRAELTERLGLTWAEPNEGLAEVAGIPRPVLRAFSGRRAEIEAALAERGLDGARAAQAAALDTRRAKDYGVDGDRLQEEWAERAEELGFGRRQLRALLDRSTKRLVRGDVSPDVNALGAELTHADATFSRLEVLQALATAARSGARLENLEHQAEQYLTGQEVLPVGVGRFSTREHVELESSLLEGAIGRLHDEVAVVDADVVEEVLDDSPYLSAEQAAMVRAVTTDGAGVSVVIGAAGAGKTTALRTARDAWNRAGHRVIGAALAARAAAELEAGSGIPSSTLASLLQCLDDPRQGFEPGTVVVVDEAGMVGTRDLARFLAAAERDAAKVVLVGDPRQLPEIEAGGAFAALGRHLGAVRLTENRRQRHRAERHVLSHLRRRRVIQAIVSLNKSGKVITAPSHDAARQRLVEDWARSFAAREDAVMLATRRRAVADLNARARRQLRSAGLLGEDAVVVNGVGFAVGDRVVALRNRRSLGVMNGSRATVRAFTDNGAVITLDTGTTVTVGMDYLADGHLAHGYAMTVHKAQGMTCDRAFVLADEGLYLEAGYTALSRGRESNHLYASSLDTVDDSLHEVRHGRWRPIELLRSLHRSGAKEMASEREREGAGLSW